MKSVAVVSSKGGVGKTTICHLLAVGSSWRATPSYVFHTDHREPMKCDGRPYRYIDARDQKRLVAVADKLFNSEGFCIFDGGGNRDTFDLWIAKVVNLVLVPVTPDTEAVDMGIDTMAKFERAGHHHARYILNMTSSNRHSSAYDAEHYFCRLPANRIAGSLKRVDAVKRLRNSDTNAPFPTPPTNVNNLSRSLFRIVERTLEQIEPEQESH